MIYGSVCSGIEAATQAWHPMGWRPAFFSEIEKFPSAVLAHHYGSNMPGEPLAHNGVPNYGDMTKFEEWSDHAIDLLIGGTPCQSFSVAGLRKGLADPRGNLMLTFGAIAAKYRPRWLVWENVPGVLSSNKGRDFGTFLGMLGQLGYGFAYAVLDTQYCRTPNFPVAIPQRRRRVFVVGYLGDWRRAAAVLFDAESLQGHPAPRREAGKGIAGTLAARTCRSIGAQDAAANHLIATNSGMVSNTICANSQQSLDAETETLLAVAHTLKGDGFDASEDGTGRGTPIVPISQAVAFAQNQRGELRTSDVAPQLTTGGGKPGEGYPAVAFDMRGRDGGSKLEGPHDTANIRAASGGSSRSYIAEPWAIRRLTPRECDRLQGSEDDYTRIPWRGKPAEDCPDGPRYKAQGNGMSKNVLEFIAQRIEMVEAL